MSRNAAWTWLTLVLPLALGAGACSRTPDPDGDPAPAPVVSRFEPSSPEDAEAPGDPQAPGLDEPVEIATVTEVAGPGQLLAREREVEARERELEARERELARAERRVVEDLERAENAAVELPTSAPPPQPLPGAPASDRYAAAEPEGVATVHTPPAPAYREVPLTVPAGTVLSVEILEGLSSETSRPGDEVRGRVVEGVMVDGFFAIPSGSLVSGSVTEAVKVKKIGGRARLAVELDRLALPAGESLPVRGALLESGRSETKRDATAIGGGAAAGAVVGRAVKKRNKTEGTLIGSILGAAVGAAIAARTDGEPVELPAGSLVEVLLAEEVGVVVRAKVVD